MIFPVEHDLYLVNSKPGTLREDGYRRTRDMLKTVPEVRHTHTQFRSGPSSLVIQQRLKSLAESGRKFRTNMVKKVESRSTKSQMSS